VDVGLVVELWNKGMLWDKLMGTHWLSLSTVKQSSKVRPITARRNALRLLQRLNASRDTAFDFTTESPSM